MELTITKVIMIVTKTKDSLPYSRLVCCKNHRGLNSFHSNYSAHMYLFTIGNFIKVKSKGWNITLANRSIFKGQVYMNVSQVSGSQTLTSSDHKTQVNTTQMTKNNKPIHPSLLHGKPWLSAWKKAESFTHLRFFNCSKRD